MRATNSTFDTTIGAPLAPASITATGAEAAYWALRVGAAMCLIGHGAFGFITKAAWLPYFGVIGIPESWAWKLMPLIGAVDVTAGMAILFAPRALPLVYLSVWAIVDGAPSPAFRRKHARGGRARGELRRAVRPVGVDGHAALCRASCRPARGTDEEWTGLTAAMSILKWTTVLLLVGHGLLGVVNHKAVLMGHYATIGLPADAVDLIGWFEILLAAAIVVRPAVGLLLFVAAWKIATESLFVVSGAPVWEFVERGGSYAAPLALAALMRYRRSISDEWPASPIG